MKRKIAILLASVMTLSMLPMNLFAASTNHFTKTPTTIPPDTLLYEEGFYGLDSAGVSPTRLTSGASLYEIDGDADMGVDYAVEGSNFVITPTDVLRGGDTFRVRLTNASWFFRSSTTATTNPNATLAATIANLNTSRTALVTAGVDVTWDEVKKADTESTADFFEVADSAFPVTTVLGMTYDPEWGVWVPRDKAEDETSGSYFRTNRTAFKSIRGEASQIPYRLIVSPLDDSVATIEILGAPDDEYDPGNANAGYNDIVIPLVTKVSDATDVKLKVESSLTGVSSGTYIYGVTGSGKTTLSIKGAQTNRDEFEIDRLIIAEDRLRSLEDKGSISITAPDGFTWADVDSADVGVFTDTGLEWGNKTTADKNEGKRYDVEDSEDIIHLLAYDTLEAKNKRIAEMSSRIPATYDYALGYDFIEHSRSHTTTGAGTTYHDDYGNGRHYDTDENTLVLSVNNFKVSEKVPGSVYIEGLKLVADDTAPMGDIMVKVKDIEDDEWGVSEDGVSVKFGTRSDFGLSLTAKTPLPTLVAGRYEDPSSIFYDDYQQTARVTLKEVTRNSWWAGRTTTLTLPEGVKYSQVDITDAEEMKQEDELKDGVYFNDGKKHGNVTLDGNVLTFTNLAVNADENGSIVMDMWLSIVPDFQGKDGKIMLKLGGTALGTAKEQEVAIANYVNPVTVKADKADIKIGYQYQETADITIEETKAGNLVRGERVNVSVTDMISTDVAFSPMTKIAVADGSDIKIKNITTTGEGSWYTKLSDVSTNAISFDVDKSSTKPSKIVISNVSVKVDRTVPLSNNRPYDVVVWGSAIAKNFNTTAEAKKDQFSTPGIRTNYIRVVSAAADQTDVLSREVRVTKGERTFSVNGVVQQMDAAAYISTKSNSMMVPIRFVANAFGLTAEQILWDDATKKVTLNHPSKTIQVAVGSDQMVINGASTTMMSLDGLHVTAENDLGDGHVYIPFRAMGDAFGVKVDFETDTNTAVYNKGANVNAKVAATTTTTTTTTAQ